MTCEEDLANVRAAYELLVKRAERGEAEVAVLKRYREWHDDTTRRALDATDDSDHVHYACSKCSGLLSLERGAFHRATLIELMDEVD